MQLKWHDRMHGRCFTLVGARYVPQVLIDPLWFSQKYSADPLWFHQKSSPDISSCFLTNVPHCKEEHTT